VAREHFYSVAAYVTTVLLYDLPAFKPLHEGLKIKGVPVRGLLAR